MTDNKYKKAIDKVRFDENLDKRIIDYLSNNISRYKSKFRNTNGLFVLIASKIVIGNISLKDGINKISAIL